MISIVFSAFLIFVLLKEFTSKALSLAGALIYIYTPYRSTDIYIRGAIGEALAFVFFPAALLCIYKLSIKDRLSLRWIGLGALSLSGLVLSHNIATYMFLPFAILFFLFLVFPKVQKKRVNFWYVILMLILGFSGASFFWVPALLDSGLVKYDTVFNFKDHFPTLIQLIRPYFGYGASVPGPYDGMSFFMGAINIVLIVLTALSITIFRKRYSPKQKILLIWCLASVLISIFMMNFRSTYFWDNLPLLPYFQFPWRFLMITTFATPLLVVSLDVIKFKELTAAILIVATILINGNFFKPHDFLARDDSYYLNRYIPAPQASADYKLTQEEYLRLPNATLERPAQNYPIVTPDDPSIVQVNTINSLHHLINISTPQEKTFNYNKYFFPGWVLKINGRRQYIKIGEPFGQITFTVPKGNTLVEVYFQETVFKRILDVVSLLALILAIRLSINSQRLNKAGSKIKHD